MSITFRPGVKEKVPLMIALAGPSKSGKTMSAHRLATGMVGGNPRDVFMINTEGPRGHMYLDEFPHLVYDLDEPYAMDRYREAILAAKDAGCKALIIDSLSHAHEGPGGLLDWHERELDRMLGNDKDNWKRREQLTWAAWVKPKAAEAQLIGTMISVSFPIVVCLRAKEKLEIKKGEQPKDLGWQPICSDRVSFETVATLVLPAGCNGVPDLRAQGTGMRKPLVPLIKAEQIDEGLGRRLMQWANETKAPAPDDSPKITEDQVTQLMDACEAVGIKVDDVKKAGKLEKLGDLPAARLEGTLAWIAKQKKGGS